MSVDGAFWQVHEDLPRQGPGSNVTTLRLFNSADPRREFRDAIDMGCGPGRASLLLASLGLHVTAIDTHAPFLGQLRRDAQAQSLIDKVEIVQLSMDDTPFLDASFDLVWAEGTAYILGWDRALRQWKRLLTPNGRLVATDSFWLTQDRSPEAVEFWAADPLMMTVDEAAEIARQAGYVVVDTYVQPDSDWFDEYYEPLLGRVDELAPGTDPQMQEVLAMTRTEIDVRRRYGAEYGHVGFVLAQPHPADTVDAS